MSSKTKTYFKNIGTALSRLISTILGGDPEDTISLRLAQCKDRCRVCFFLCRFLELFDKDHCNKATKRKSIDEDTELWSWK